MSQSQSQSQRLLCISNGHGEDAIATRILQVLRQQVPSLELAAIAMVGEGAAYRRDQIPLVGPTQTLPSGGFIYMDRQQLAQDVQSGLLRLTWQQLQAARTWAQSGGGVLAVGDVIPQAVAWLSGAPYAAIATAKSEYWRRDEAGPLADRPWYEGWAGSVFLPWERWLMGHPRCRVAFVRDPLTAKCLQRFGIPAAAANPMMDGLAPDPKKLAWLRSTLPSPCLTLLLLPGSRAPECWHNWRQILVAVEGVLQRFAEPVGLLAAVVPALPLEQFQAHLQASGWQAQSATTYGKANGTLRLVADAYGECLALAEAAIATAGTATEQFVGLGKPALTFAGAGPQFTRAFAEAQARLLGPSVILLEQPTDVAAALAACRQDPERLAQIQANGRRRMGEAGAAEAMASSLRQHLIAAGVS